MRRSIFTRIIALLLTVTTMGTQLPSSFLTAAGSRASATAEQSVLSTLLSGNGVSSDNITAYYEVQFAWPEDLEWLYEAKEALEAIEDAEEASEAAEGTSSEGETSDSETEAEDDITALPDMIQLPEAVTVDEGTLLSDLPVPTVAGYVFLGWYYDSALEQRAGSEDTVQKNITLYPSMGNAEEQDIDQTIDYITYSDVAGDFEVILAAYNITEEEIYESVVLNDFAWSEDEKEYTLTALEPNLMELITEDTVTVEEDATAEDGTTGVNGTVTEDGMTTEEDATAEDAASTVPAQAEAASDEEETPVITKEQLLAVRTAAAEAIADYKAEELETTLAEALYNLGIDRMVVRHLVTFYAPEELTRSDFYTVEIEEELQKLGMTGYESQEEIISILKNTFVSEEELLAYLQNELAFETASMAELEAMRSEDFFTQIETYVREKTLAEEDPYPFLYQIMDEDGRWAGGSTYQIVLPDTEHFRFYMDGEYTDDKVIYCNLQVPIADYNDMRILDGVIFIPASEVSGVDITQGLISVEQDENGNLNTVNNTYSGVMYYDGDLSSDDVVAVYEGTISENGIVDGDVTYLRIVGSPGSGMYAYTTPDFEEVVFIPDNIPVRDDGSFEDGQVLLTWEQMDFTGRYVDIYSEMGLDADTTVEKGDLITVYSGSFDDPEDFEIIGYGCITEIADDPDGLLLSYEIRTEEEFYRSAGFSITDMDVPISMTEEEQEELAKTTFNEMMEEGGVMQEAAGYIEALILADDEEIQKSASVEKLTSLVFVTDTGENMTLGEVREMASGGTVTWDSSPKVSWNVGFNLKHFQSTGLRLMLAVDWGFNINFSSGGNSSKNSTLRFNVGLQFEEEVPLGISGDCHVEWGKVKVAGITIFKYPKTIIVYAALTAGTFTTAGIQVSFQTQAAKDNKTVDETFDKLLDKAIGEQGGINEDNVDATNSKISATAKIANATQLMENFSGYLDGWGSDGASDHDTLGGGYTINPEYRYYTRYSDLLNNNAEYVPIFTQKILDNMTLISFWGIVTITLTISFKVQIKVNVVLGLVVSYTNVKQLAVTVDIFAGESRENENSTQPPEFRFDAFAFGMLGLKVSLEFDLRLGIVSTKIASIGVILEIGVRAEMFGFVYFTYYWISGQGADTDYLGTFLIKVSLFAELKGRAQLGDGRLKYDTKALKTDIPLLTIGQEKVWVDFDVENDEDRAMEIDLGSENSTVLPKNFFKMLGMGVKDGKTSSTDLNTSSAWEPHGTFTAMGQTYEQTNEKYFTVECIDLDENGQSTGTCSWLYDPVKNTISAKPHDASTGELWGEITFTFRNQPNSWASVFGDSEDKVDAFINYGAGFGFKKGSIQRTVKVHWKGEPVTRQVEIYTANAPETMLDNIDKLSTADAATLASAYTKVAETTLDGFNGSLVAVAADDALLDQGPKYEFAFSIQDQNEFVDTFYTNRGGMVADETFANKTRVALYEKQGYVWALPDDTLQYFSTNNVEESIRLYFNIRKVDSSWTMMADDTDTQVAGFAELSVKLPWGYPVLEYVPSAVWSKLEDNRYEYDYYILPNTPGVMKTKTVTVNGQTYTISGGYYSALEAALMRRSEWLPLTEETVVPGEPFTVILVRKNASFTVTWVYDEGEVKTTARYQEELTAPRTPTRKGYTFVRWEEANGTVRTTMPNRDLTLYPTFIGDEHTVTWIWRGQTKQTTVRTGENILASVPFDTGDSSQGIHWSKSSQGESYLSESDVLGNEDLTLYGTTYQMRLIYWREENMLLARTTQEVGTAINYYVPETTAGTTYIWTLNGKWVPDGYVMPDEDISMRLVRYTVPHEHTWETLEVIQPVSCTEDGIYHMICSVCLQEKTEVVPKTGHTEGDPVEENRVEADCIHDGQYEEVIYCTVCGEELSRTTIVIPKTGVHTPGDMVIENATESLCTEGGSYDIVYYCTVCGEEISRETVELEAAGHVPGEPVKENIVPSTCKEHGTCEEVVYCSVCGEELSRTEVELPYAEHTPGEPVKENIVEPGCMEHGSYDSVIYCSVCGEEISREKMDIPPTGHTKGEPVRENEIPAACMVDGSYDEVYYCTVCGEEISRTTVPIEATGHKEASPVRENIVEATCTVEGSCDEVVYCSVCGEELSRKKIVLPVTPHTGGDPVRENYVEPTCGTDGSYEEVVYCTQCGEELSRTGHTIPATGEHDYSIEGDYLNAGPDYDEDGNLIGWHPYMKFMRCSVCGEEELVFDSAATTKLYTGDFDIYETVIRTSVVSVMIMVPQSYLEEHGYESIQELVDAGEIYFYMGTIGEKDFWKVPGTYTVTMNSDIKFVSDPEGYFEMRAPSVWVLIT